MDETLAPWLNLNFLWSCSSAAISVPTTISRTLGISYWINAHSFLPQLCTILVLFVKNQISYMYRYSKHLKIFFYIILYTVTYFHVFQSLNSNIYQEVKFKIKRIFGKWKIKFKRSNCKIITPMTKIMVDIFNLELY